jgi:excisionase family DNA binding protein
MTARLRSVGEAAEELGVSKDHVRRLISRGLVRSVRLGKRLLISQIEIDRLVVGGQPVVKVRSSLKRAKVSETNSAGESASRASKRP